MVVHQCHPAGVCGLCDGVVQANCPYFTQMFVTSNINRTLLQANLRFCIGNIVT